MDWVMKKKLLIIILITFKKIQVQELGIINQLPFLYYRFFITQIYNPFQFLNLVINNHLILSFKKINKINFFFTFNYEIFSYSSLIDLSNFEFSS